MSARIRIFSMCAAVAMCTAGAARAQQEFPADRESDDAKQLVEKFRGIAAEHPERAAAVEAYLHPLTRTLVEAAAEPEPPPEPPPAEKKTMFFVRGPGGLRPVKAEAFEKDGDVLIITAANGSKAIVQSASVAGELPWYSNEDLASGAVDLEELAASYDAIAVRAPTMKQFLEGEARRFRALIRKEEVADIDEDAELREAVARVKVETFDASANLSIDDLASVLAGAEETIAEHPQAAVEIDEWAAPFREHLGRLLAGDEWTDGRWVTAAERREREESERAARLRESIAYSLRAELVPDSVVRDAAMKPLWIAGGLAVLALAMLAISRRPVIRFAATAVLVATPVGLSLLFYLASRDAAGMPDVADGASDGAIVDLIVAAHDGAVSAMVVKQDDINAFVARRFRVVGDGAGGGLARRAQAVDLSPGRVSVFELASGYGFDWVVRCDFAWLVEDGAPSLEPTDVWIGRLPCPPALAAAVAANIEAELGAALEKTGLPRTISPDVPQDGQVAIAPVPSAEPAPDGRDASIDRPPPAG